MILFSLLSINSVLLLNTSRHSTPLTNTEASYANSVINLRKCLTISVHPFLTLELNIRKLTE